jgi:hypothetical protein
MTFKPLVFLGSILFISATPMIRGQEEVFRGLEDRAVVLDIIARVIEESQGEVWNSTNSKVTIPGRPVGLRLVGENIVVAVQFTPLFRKDGTTALVALGQIWINIPDEGIRYHTTMQTIPLEFGEQIYFFPLGSKRSPEDARIEIQLRLHPYSEEKDTGQDTHIEP